MAARRFQLPGVQELGKQQEDALMLDRDGQHLIIGGPGTGKSVVALLRARRLQRDGDDYVFLVYNRLLLLASRQLFGEALRSDTWIGWFRRTFQRMTGNPTPCRGQPWDIDWPAVERLLLDFTPHSHQNLPHLIIDEGQDMPPAFYRSLVALGFENFYVVADQNQQIEPERHSSRQDIQEALAIAPERVVELRTNYRNRYPIARLAREFYTGDPASPPPALPPVPSGGVDTPILFDYRRDQYRATLGRILTLARNQPHKLIGVIAPTDQVRLDYVAGLRAGDAAAGGMVAVRTYASRADVTGLRFDEGGIMVINAQSCKGLEFDTVFLADIHGHRPGGLDTDLIRKRFYVMTARARDRLILLRARSGDSPVLGILPRDPALLARFPRPPVREL